MSRPRANTTFSAFPWRKQRPQQTDSSAHHHQQPQHVHSHPLPPSIDNLIDALSPPAVPSLSYARQLATALSSVSPIPKRHILNPIWGSLCNPHQPTSVQAAGYDILSAYFENPYSPTDPLGTAERVMYLSLFTAAAWEGNGTGWSIDIWEPKFKALRAFTDFGKDVLGIEVMLLDLIKSWILAAFNALLLLQSDNPAVSEHERCIDLCSKFLFQLIDNDQNSSRLPDSDLVSVLHFYGDLLDKTVQLPRTTGYLPANDDPTDHQLRSKIHASTSHKHPAELAASLYLAHLTSKTGSKLLTTDLIRNQILPVLFRATAFCATPLPSLSIFTSTTKSGPLPTSKLSNQQPQSQSQSQSHSYQHAMETENKISTYLNTLFTGPYATVCKLVLKEWLGPPNQPQLIGAPLTSSPSPEHPSQEAMDVGAPVEPAVGTGKSNEPTISSAPLSPSPLPIDPNAHLTQLLSTIHATLGAHRTIRTSLRRTLLAKLVRAYISREASLGYSVSGAPARVVDVEGDVMARAWPIGGLGREEGLMGGMRGGGTSVSGAGAAEWDSRMGRLVRDTVRGWVSWRPPSLPISTLPPGSVEVEKKFSEAKERVLEEIAGMVRDMLQEVDARNDDAGYYPGYGVTGGGEGSVMTTQVDEEESVVIGEILWELVGWIKGLRNPDGSLLILKLKEGAVIPTPSSSSASTTAASSTPSQPSNASTPGVPPPLGPTASTTIVPSSSSSMTSPSLHRSTLTPPPPLPPLPSVLDSSTVHPSSSHLPNSPDSKPLLRTLTSLLSRSHAKTPLKPLLAVILIRVGEHLTDEDAAELPSTMMALHELSPTSLDWLANWAAVFGISLSESQGQTRGLEEQLEATGGGLLGLGGGSGVGRRKKTRETVMNALETVYDSVRDMGGYRRRLAELVLRLARKIVRVGVDSTSLSALSSTGGAGGSGVVVAGNPLMPIPDEWDVVWRILGDEIVLRTVEGFGGREVDGYLEIVAGVAKDGGLSFVPAAAAYTTAGSGGGSTLSPYHSASVPQSSYSVSQPQLPQSPGFGGYHRSYSLYGSGAGSGSGSGHGYGYGLGMGMGGYATNPVSPILSRMQSEYVSTSGVSVASVAAALGVTAPGGGKDKEKEREKDKEKEGGGGGLISLLSSLTSGGGGSASASANMSAAGGGGGGSVGGDTSGQEEDLSNTPLYTSPTPVDLTEASPSGEYSFSSLTGPPNAVYTTRAVSCVAALVYVFSQLAFTPFVLEDFAIRLIVRVFEELLDVVSVSTSGGEDEEGKKKGTAPAAAKIVEARVAALMFLMQLRADRDHRVYFVQGGYDADGCVEMLAGLIGRIGAGAAGGNGAGLRREESSGGEKARETREAREAKETRARASQERQQHEKQHERHGRQGSRGKGGGLGPVQRSAGSRSRSRVPSTRYLATGLAPTTAAPMSQQQVTKRDPLWYFPETLPFVVIEPDSPSEALTTYDPDPDNQRRSRLLLPVSRYLEAVVGIIEKEKEWEILSYVLCHLPLQLANKHMFCGPKSRAMTSRLLNVVCAGVWSKALGAGSARPRDAQGLAYHTLSVLISYWRCFDMQQRHKLVEVFHGGLNEQPWTIKCCLHALSMAAFELQQSTTKFLPRILENLSQIMTNPDMAVHILGYIGIIASLPPLYANFTEGDYKMVIGVALQYLQHYSQHNMSPTMSWALSQHVRVLSYYVIYVWFLAVRLPDRPKHIRYITRQLLLANEGNETVDGPTEVCFDWLARYAYATADPRPANSLLADIVMNPTQEHHSELVVKEKTWVVGNAVVTIRALARLGWIEVLSRRPSGFTKFLCRVENAPLVGPGEADLDLASVPAALLMERDPPQVLKAGPDDYEEPLEATEEAQAEQLNEIFDMQRDDQTKKLPRPNPVTGYVWKGTAPSQRRKEVVVDPSYFALQLSPYPDFLSPPSVRLLADPSTLPKFFNTIDHIPVIDTHKVGIMYVAPGQTKEVEILRNTHGSPAYTRFLEGLGRLINLRGQLDVYAGGLDPDEDGEYAYAWWDDIGQILYHTATMMPTSPYDPQSNNKKRHIGNDYVRIVWNDSGFPYRFDTLSTQFQFVNIVIEPHSLGAIAAYSNNAHENEYFKVTVQRAPGMTEFAPIGNFKLISAQNLPLLVRQMSLLSDWFAAIFSQTNRDTTRAEVKTNWQMRLEAIRRFRSQIPEPELTELTIEGIMKQEAFRDFSSTF